jgi:transcription elongation factor GreB
MPRFMTLDGYKAIQDEIDDLWHDKRPDVVQQVQDAASLGDRSENAEYIYGKKRLYQIDGRIRYLTRKVDEVTVVDVARITPEDRIKFGARVTVEDEDGEQKIYRLVDKDESDPDRGRISVQSPVGQALLGKLEGDVVQVHLPRGVTELEVITVFYGAGEP